MNGEKCLTDSALMNDLAVSRGKNDGPLLKLMKRHERLVVNTLRQVNVRGADVDDVAAMVWERIWKIGGSGLWSVSRASHASDPFIPLLKKITRNLAIDFHRRASRRRKRVSRIKELVVMFGDDWRGQAMPHPRLARADRSAMSGVPDCLVSVLSLLPERLRRAYGLHAEGLSCRQIAVQLKCSPASASRWVARARKEVARLSPSREKG